MKEHKTGAKDGAGSVYPNESGASSGSAAAMSYQPSVEDGLGHPDIIKNRMETHHNANTKENRRGR